MSERFERWSAREKIRSHIGWVAVWCGVFGAWFLIAVVANLFDAERASWSRAALGVVMGLALLAAARGLWNARSWARWLFFGVSASLAAAGVARLFMEDPFDGMLVWLPALAVAVYLALPSTGRRFARASGRVASSS